LSADERKLYVKLNQTVKRVSESFDRLQFNTAVAALMELVRDYRPELVKVDEFNDQVILKTIQMIAPMAPHLAEEMWQLAGYGDSVFKSEWPEFDPEALLGDTVEIAVQVNGKLRGSVQVPVGCEQTVVEEAAFADAKILAHIQGKGIVRKIHVAGRLLNIVVKG